MIAKFNNTEFDLVEFPSIDKSSRETTFSGAVIDFTDYTIADLPIKYQTIEIINDTTTILKGFVSDFEFPSFNGEEKKILLSLTIIPPQTFLTFRTITTQIDKETIHDAVETILANAILDGFYIAENTLSETRYYGEIIVNESIEVILNRLANKYNFMWYVGEDKDIHLKDIDELITAEPVATIDSVPYEYLETITPKIEIVDYANKLNMKNIRLVSYYYDHLPIGTTLQDGQLYYFAYPISIGENVARRLPEYAELSDTNYLFYLSTDSGGSTEYTIEVDLTTGVVTYDAEIGFMGENDDDTQKILLIRDPFLKTVVVGFKWQGADEEIILDPVISEYGMYSGSTLLPYNFIYLDSTEINNNKIKLGTAGIVEKVIDMHEKFYTRTELDDVAIGLFKRCNTQNNQVQLTFYGLLEDTDLFTLMGILDIGSIIKMDLATYYTQGNYIITDTSQRIEGQTVNYVVNARSSNLNESFLDLFRPIDKQEDEDKLAFNTIAFYSRDGDTVIGHEIEVGGEIVNA